jgi:hypothetical protein
MWHDLTPEDAKCWIIVMDLVAGVFHAVPEERLDDRLVLEMPSLPGFLAEVILSASSRIVHHGLRCILHIPITFSPLVRMVWDNASIRPYERAIHNPIGDPRFGGGS